MMIGAYEMFRISRISLNPPLQQQSSLKNPNALHPGNDHRTSIHFVKCELRRLGHELPAVTSRHQEPGFSFEI